MSVLSNGFVFALTPAVSATLTIDYVCIGGGGGGVGGQQS